MVVLDDVVHILAGPALPFLGQQVVLLEIANGANVRRVLVNIDYTRCCDVRPAHGASEKPLSRPSAAGLI